MNKFRKTDAGEFNLEEDRSSHTAYRWASLEPKRLASGHVNPTSIAEALKLHTLVSGMAPHYLASARWRSTTWTSCSGSTSAATGTTTRSCPRSLLGESRCRAWPRSRGPGRSTSSRRSRVALSDDCRLQARIDVVTRTNSYQVRTGDYNDDVISVY